MKRNVDYIIVGQGIAGSVLALELYRNNKSVVIINDENESLASKTAAGIWNPVVFKRLTKSWLADDLIPSLNQFYSTAENLLQRKIIHKIKIAKLFTEEQEIKLWSKKSADEMKDFLDPKIYAMESPVSSTYGTVEQTGYLDSKLFLSQTKKFFKTQQLYREEKFNHSQLVINEKSVEYGELGASKIIFCEGYKIKDNPFFSWIPMKPAKGDVLTIFCKELSIDFILNKSVFVLPLGNHLFKVGATYDWLNLNDIPDTKAKEELIIKLNKIIPYPFQIVSHEAGVRPAVIDRRPVIGNHPEYENLIVFNGFGTKAVMLVPYFAKQLVNNLINNQTVSEEVDLNRFYSI